MGKLIRAAGLLAVILSLLWASEASSQPVFFTGTSISVYMNSSNDELKRGVYLGFIAGVVDSLNGRKFKIPKNTDLKDLADKVTYWLTQNGDKWEKPASVLVAEALADCFPLVEKGIIKRKIPKPFFILTNDHK